MSAQPYSREKLEEERATNRNPRFHIGRVARLLDTLDERDAEIERLRSALHAAEAIGDFAVELRNRLSLKENAEACAKMAAEAIEAGQKLAAQRDVYDKVLRKAAQRLRGVDCTCSACCGQGGECQNDHLAKEIESLLDGGGEGGGVTQQGDDTVAARPPGPGRVLSSTTFPSAAVEEAVRKANEERMVVEMERLNRMPKSDVFYRGDGGKAATHPPVDGEDMR
jgi:hypothetical protein